MNMLEDIRPFSLEPFLSLAEVTVWVQDEKVGGHCSIASFPFSLISEQVMFAQ